MTGLKIVHIMRDKKPTSLEELIIDFELDCGKKNVIKFNVKYLVILICVYLIFTNIRYLHLKVGPKSHTLESILIL